MNLKKLEQGDTATYRTQGEWPGIGGYFGLCYGDSKKGLRIYWGYCREHFFYVWRDKIKRKNTGSEFIFYLCDDWKRTARFIDALERKLKIKDKSVCGLLLGDGGRGVWIRIASWWTSSSIRREFFTMALRASRYYTKDVCRAIFSTDYGHNTKDAVKKFLSGYTFGKLRWGGWEDTFSFGQYIENLRKTA